MEAMYGDPLCAMMCTSAACNYYCSNGYPPCGGCWVRPEQDVYYENWSQALYVVYMDCYNG